MLNIYKIFNFNFRFQNSLVNSKCFTEYSKFKVINDAVRDFEYEAPRSELRFSSSNNLNINQEEAKDNEYDNRINTFANQRFNLEDRSCFEQDYDKTNYNKNPEEVNDKLLSNKAFEREVRENEEFIDTKIFLALYERRIGFWIPSTHKLNFEVSRTIASQRYLLADLAFLKIRLPNFRKIKIDHISDGDKDLNNFIRNCIPAELELLCINYYFINNIGIKMNFYLNSITKAITSVTNEIYFNNFEISEYDLEQIIKSAYKCKRLMFNFCDIHCSKKLNFKITKNYKINLLSFCGCGCKTATERKSDWKKTPSIFKNIIVAISECGLKDSLKQVNINYNETLKKDKVQELFNNFGMSQISVVNTFIGLTY